MASLEERLTPQQLEALTVLRQRLQIAFQIETIMLYGSVARGEADSESDIDLLVLTTRRLSHFERHQITDAIFEVNLQYDTNFSSMVVDRRSWESSLMAVFPIRAEIARDGIAV
jgi:predicted nucleotidyltransferase